METQREQLTNNVEDFPIINVIVAAFVVLITLVLFFIWRSRKASGQSILLTGLTDVGKTLLYTKLFTSKPVNTYTSAKENISSIIINNKTMQIIDIPGHERLRYKFFDKYKKSARALVYVIDSVTLPKDIRDAAEFLYTLLVDEAIQRDVSLLILCNKQDQATAKGCSVIQTLLEKEINLLRLTKANQLEATDSSTTNTFLGKQGKDFEFSHLGNRVDFAECSALDITQLKSWLEKVV